MSTTRKLQATLNLVKETCINSINETLRNRNHGIITFNKTITNNWCDDVDNEQITGYDIDSNTVQIDMNGNYYDISVDEIKLETLIQILQAIENEEYSDLIADDE